MSIFRRKKNLKENAEKIISEVEEKVADEEASEEKLAKIILEATKDFLITPAENGEPIHTFTEEEEAKFLQHLTTAVFESQMIPNKAAGKVMTSAIQSDEISDSAVIAAAKEKADIFPDELIVEIVKTDIAEPSDARVLAEGIEDSKTKEKLLEDINISALENLYSECADLNLTEIQDKLEKINYKVENYANYSDKFKNLLQKIVAKKAALSFTSRSAISMYKLKKIMPCLDMFEAKIPDLAEREYRIIKNNNPKKDIPEYLKDIFNNYLLSEIADEISEQYRVQPANNRAYTIPDILTTLTESEKKFFLKQLKFKSKCNNGVEVNDSDLKDAENQLRGYDNIQEIIDLKTLLQTIPDKTRKKEITQNILKIANYIISVPENSQTDLAQLLEEMSEQIVHQFKDRAQKQSSKSSDNSSHSNHTDNTEPTNPNGEDGR